MKKIIAFICATMLASVVSAEETNKKVEEKLMTAEELTQILDLEGLESELLEEKDFESILDELSLENHKGNDLFTGRRGNWNRDRWNRGGRHQHPRRERYAPRRPMRSQVVCVAENLRGHRFTAVGMRPYRVQQRAFSKCERYSRRCFEVGCYRQRRGRPGHIGYSNH